MSISGFGWLSRNLDQDTKPLILQRADIPLRLAKCAGTEQPAHDFAAARLWKTVNKGNVLRASDRANLVGDVLAQLFSQLIALLKAGTQNDIAMNGDFP